MNRGVKKIKRTSHRQVRVGVVVSEYHTDVTGNLLRGALVALKEGGIKPKNITVKHVSGSFEVAQLAARYARSKKVEVLVCLGVIVKGETSHDQHLANAVTQSLLKTGADTGVAVGLGVITANNLQQAQARAHGTRNRGYDAAAAALRLADEIVHL